MTSTTSEHAADSRNHPMQTTTPLLLAATGVIGITATWSWTNRDRVLLSNASRYSNADRVGDFLADSFALSNTLGFRDFTANSVGHLAGFGFANPLGFANRYLFRFGFANVSCATAINGPLLLLANPFCTAVVDDFLLLLANPFRAAVVDRFSARLAYRTANGVRALDGVLFTAVLGATNLLGFAGWDPYFPANGSTWCLATYLVARAGVPCSTTGARVK
jgi:hypothetical protein